MIKELRSAEDLAALVEEVGFLPFFKGEIPGFSVEEHTPRELWWEGEEWAAWEWKGPVIRMSQCAYGKFYRGKAMYISRALFPDFANFRRDGYDYDARVDEGLARGEDTPVMQALLKTPSLVSKQLKARVCFSKESGKRFDASLTRLQMQGYLNIKDFVYPLDRTGKPYGWGLAEYTTPEAFYGEEFTSRVYRNAPETSYGILAAHLQKLLPHASTAQIDRILRG